MKPIDYAMWADLFGALSLCVLALLSYVAWFNSGGDPRDEN